MERDGQIMRNRRGALCVVEKLGFIHGRVEGHRDGFGFVIPDDGSDDLYLSPWEMSKVLHGDHVVAREVAGRQGKREASIVEVGMRGNTTVVGRLHRRRLLLRKFPTHRLPSRSISVVKSRGVRLV